MSDGRPEILKIYRRIQCAFDKKVGVRLSADEVEAMWLLDDAISRVVYAAMENGALGEVGDD